METKNKYQFPIDKDKIIRISRRDSIAHKIYKYSVDFIVSVGTPIKAAAPGVVVDAKGDSEKFGKTRKYEEFENFIEICHRGNEYSYYGHLKKGGALVGVGDKVKAGRIIGYSGKTGWMANIKEPHLHFMVGKYNYGEKNAYETLKIKFKKS